MIIDNTRSTIVQDWIRTAQIVIPHIIILIKVMVRPNRSLVPGIPLTLNSRRVVGAEKKCGCVNAQSLDLLPVRALALE